MFLLDWYDTLLMIRERYRKDKVCESCETLKMQLAISNEEKQQLLDRLLNPVKPEEPKVDPNPKAILPSRHLSFNVRRQFLEREDRERAKAIKKNEEEAASAAKLKPATVELTTQDIERELGVDDGEDRTVEELHSKSN